MVGVSAMIARAYFAVQAVAGAAWWVAVFTVPWVREATLGSLDPVLVAAFDVPLFVAGSAVAAWGVRVAAIVTTGWTILVAAALAVFATVTTEAGWGVLIMAAAAGFSALALALLLAGRIPTEWMIAGPFAFRPSTKQRGHVASTFIQLVFFWGFFLVVAPAVIAFLEQRWHVHVEFAVGLRIAGVVIFVIASALGLWSAVTMSSIGKGTPLPSSMPTRLVIAGPYRFVRNPMAVAGIVQGAAVGLILSSWLVVAYALIGSVIWNYAVRPHEEADLASRFGDDFERYRARVRCWVPRLASQA